jgi:hypothetical protein
MFITFTVTCVLKKKQVRRVSVLDAYIISLNSFSYRVGVLNGDSAFANYVQKSGHAICCNGAAS